MDLTIRVVRDLSSVDPAAWDRLEHGDSPFLRYGFLRALEITASIGGDSGWEPLYVLAELGDGSPTTGATGATSAGAGLDGGHRLVGAIPCFVKHHSYGEYIFDFGWARAAMRAGLAYYPKLVIAAPVTPATGRRILLAPELPRRDDVARALIGCTQALADELGCSSIHWLFTTADEQALLESCGLLSRTTYQFHWANKGYPDFEAFLATMASRKRKQVRKERARARGAIDAIDFVPAAAWTDDDVADLDAFYRSTVHAHGGQDYLRRGFFEELRRRMPAEATFARARRGDRTIAGALYFETSRALYGRYWGCHEHIDCLHFEVAYYSGIDRCIERGLTLFEAGAQGEHKLLRGFEPAPTFSAHWIRHAGLRGAIARALEEEAAGVPDTMQALQSYTPYKKG